MVSFVILGLSNPVAAASTVQTEHRCVTDATDPLMNLLFLVLDNTDHDSLSFERYHYKSPGKCGIRQKKPVRTQLFEFGDFSVLKEDLYEIADQAITRLLAKDLAIADAKSWCLERLESLKQS